MHKRHGFIRSLAVLVLGASLGLSSPSEACTPGRCILWVNFPLPKSGQVPANVPALVVLPGLGDGFRRSPGDTPRLMKKNGSLVAASREGAASGHGGYLIAPAAHLVPGKTYRLHARSFCAGGSGVEATFTVGPARPLPQATGKLELEQVRQGQIVVLGGASCSSRVEASSAFLRFTPAPELEPFLPWVSWKLEVDGEPWATAPHGAIERGGILNFKPNFFYTRGLLHVYAACAEPEPGGGDRGVGPGRHRARLTGTLENSPFPLPPVEVDFELTCTSSKPVEPPPPSQPREPGADPLPGETPSVPKAPLPNSGCLPGAGAGAMAVSIAGWAALRRRLHLNRRGTS